MISTQRASHLPWLSLWWIAVTIASRYVHSPRLPGECLWTESLGSMLGYCVLMFPLRDRRLLGGIPAVVYVLGHYHGNLWAHKWALPVLMELGGYSRMKSLALLTVLGLALGGSFWLLLRLGSALRRSSIAIAVLVFGGVLATGEYWISSYLPWIEPTTTGFLIADVWGGPSMVQVAGTALACFLFTCLTASVLLQSWRCACGSLAAFAVALSLAQLARAAADRDEVVTVPIDGLQIAPKPAGADWRARQVEIYREAEAQSTSLIVVWPERAYPFIERIEHATALAHLAMPAHQTRILGLHASVNLFGVANAVLVQEPDENGGTMQYRYKRRLAPLYETRRLSIATSPDELLTIRRHRAFVPICYEILDRQYFQNRAASLGISISADTFDRSGAASVLLTRATWLRSLEFGIPFVRVSNASYSAAFDRQGHVLRQLGRGDGVLRASVPVLASPRTCGRSQRSFVCALMLIVAVCLAHTWMAARNNTSRLGG